MNDERLVNIARLMTTYNFEIEELPDNLKCAQCKLVLKDACHLPCFCKYCRVCIEDMMMRGSEFCPGLSEECGESPLSHHQSDYLANRKVSRLVVKCPHDGCVHKCQLVNIEDHLQECQRNSEECPFRELGCTPDKLAAEEMGGHFQHENRRHSELLIGLIVNINKEIETLKQKDEANSKQIEKLNQRDQASLREIDTIKRRDEASRKEIDTLKHGMVLKDEQINSIMDQMIHLQNENKSMKNDIKLIKEEKEDLAGRVRTLTEIIEQEIAERSKNDELDSARVIEHVDREMAAVTLLISLNKNEFFSEMQSLRGNIESRNQYVQSIKDDICSLKRKLQSVKTLVGLGHFDASFVWLIEFNVDNTGWDWKESKYFSGEVQPYKYRLASSNSQIGIALTTLRYVTGNTEIGNDYAALSIDLRIYPSPNDEQLAWPFEARVVITITDRDRREVCRSISRHCRIERPADDDWRGSDPFKFLHSDLRGAGLNLSCGVYVSCTIVPNVG